jgi:hypothetical protein
MRVTPLIAAVLSLTLSASGLAQEWIEFSSREDRFTGNFPSQPKVMQTTYQSRYGADSQIEKIVTAKAQSCAIRTEGCFGSTRWRLDYQGAIVAPLLGAPPNQENPGN